MSQPQITYRGMAHSPAMDAKIIELAARLDDLHPKITSCHVVVDELDRHKTKGNLFEVRVDLHVPGKEIVATHKQNEDAYVALHDAFNVVQRQLEESIRIQRAQVKHRGDEPEPS